MGLCVVDDRGLYWVDSVNYDLVVVDLVYCFEGTPSKPSKNLIKVNNVLRLCQVVSIVREIESELNLFGCRREGQSLF